MRERERKREIDLLLEREGSKRRLNKWKDLEHKRVLRIEEEPEAKEKQVTRSYDPREGHA